MPPIFLVVDDPQAWTLDLPNVEVVSGFNYLNDARLSGVRSAKVFNLCRSYKYQSVGYYVSLLATARGHRAFPGLQAMQDLRTVSVVRSVSDELDKLIQKTLAPIQSDKFTLSVYFGHNVAKRYDRLALHLFNIFQAPLLRATFARVEGEWELRGIRPVPLSEIPRSHVPDIHHFAAEYLARAPRHVGRRKPQRYSLAILFDPEAPNPPSDDKAIERFERAATKLGFATEVIGKDDIGRLGEFDALFIRETTSVLHHTYRFARRAAAEDLTVIDDPLSILKCTNKVYQHEVLARHKIPTPPTYVVPRGGGDGVLAKVGLPCVLKQPDSAFSMGVHRATTKEEFDAILARLFEHSELVVVQGFIQSDFDWRIGVIDQKPLFACKYFMAPKHWQIQRQRDDGSMSYGKWETMPVELAPRKIVRTALAAANLIGDGLYGVDVKQVGSECYVMEINDNPNIESGVEDQILKDELYLRVMQVFANRIEARRATRP